MIPAGKKTPGQGHAHLRLPCSGVFVAMPAFSQAGCFAV